MMSVSHGGRLPAEYQEVEYIESGAQGPYLSFPATGAAARNFKTELVFEANAMTTAYTLALCAVFASPFNGVWAIWPKRNSGEWWMKGSNILSFASVYLNKWTSVSDGMSVTMTDGTTTLTGSYSATEAQLNALQNGKINLLNYNDSTAVTNKGGGIIYSFKVWDGTTPFYNLVPCYRKSDSKPGMYDLVTKTFFTNAGTGEFTVGPDV